MLTTLRTGLQLGLLLGAPQTPQAQWWPTTGAVILSGGNLDDRAANALVDRLIALAGGPDALIVVIPSAADGLPAALPAPGAEPACVAAIRRILEARGARHVVFLHTSSHAVANSEEFVRILRTARAVFFTGGRSKVLDQTYHGTLVERELKALLDRGGVLAGDSAGAITIGCFWLSWPTPTSALGKVTDGLCLLPRVTVTPHVRPGAARIAEDEMTDSIRAWTSKHPGTVAINIQEHTVLVLTGGTAEVLGSGGVSIFGALADPRATIHLKAGATRDLRTPEG
jgi:cyanophycinase